MRFLVPMGLLALLILQVACAGTRVPRDLAAFIERRDLCDYFRGEIPDPGDDGRMEEVNASIERYCIGSDHELARLKRKYAGNARLMDMMSGYEAEIEAKPGP